MKHFLQASRFIKAISETFHLNILMKAKITQSHILYAAFLSFFQNLLLS